MTDCSPAVARMSALDSRAYVGLAGRAKLGAEIERVFPPC